MTVLIDPSDEAQIYFVVQQLRENQPVALPTETVYGLAARALSDKALARIFEMKARPTFDPLIVHVLDFSDIEKHQIAKEITPLHKKLIQKFWPGPLTLLFLKSEKISDLCTASTSYVALRSPSHPVFRRVLELLGEPLAAPSANRFQSISPTEAHAVIEELGPHGLVAVVEGGAAQRGIESTVLKIHSPVHVEIVRHGAISSEEIKEFLGDEIQISQRASGSGISEEASREAPGQSEVHYSPQKKLYLLSEEEAQSFLNQSSIKNWALLEVFPTKLENSAIKTRATLSDQNSWSEAASKLFSTLRSLDKDTHSEAILAIDCPRESLGAAIRDRLFRASQKH